MKYVCNFMVVCWKSANLSSIIALMIVFTWASFFRRTSSSGKSLSSITRQTIPSISRNVWVNVRSTPTDLRSRSMMTSLFINTMASRFWRYTLSTKLQKQVSIVCPFDVLACKESLDGAFQCWPCQHPGIFQWQKSSITACTSLRGDNKLPIGLIHIEATLAKNLSDDTGWSREI